jgi:hypothetical protein
LNTSCLLLLADRRSSDPAFRLNGILGLQEKAMRLLPFSFALQG